MVLHPQPSDPLDNPSHSELHRRLAGGTANQVYTKASGVDYDAVWTTGGGGSGSWTAFTTYSPKVGAVDYTDKVMVEDTYDVDTKRLGRYRTNGSEVYVEFAIVPGGGSTGEPNIFIGPNDPVFTCDITGGPGGGTFQLSFDSYHTGTGSVVGVLVTFNWNVDAPTMQADIRGADGRLNNIGVTVSGANPNFTITMPRASLGAAFAHSSVALNNNSLTGGTTPGVTVTQTVFEHVTDDIFYIGLPLPMDGTNLWNYSFDNDESDVVGFDGKFPVRTGNAYITYDGQYSPSMTGAIMAFPMSADNPNFNTDYLNWCAIVSETTFPGSSQGTGYPVLWDDFNVFGTTENVITGALTYFTATPVATVALYDVGLYDVNVYG